MSPDGHFAVCECPTQTVVQTAMVEKLRNFVVVAMVSVLLVTVSTTVTGIHGQMKNTGIMFTTQIQLKPFNTLFAHFTSSPSLYNLKPIYRIFYKYSNSFIEILSVIPLN